MLKTLVQLSLSYVDIILDILKYQANISYINMTVFWESVRSTCPLGTRALVGLASNDPQLAGSDG